jgi:DNA-binding response OmpR family regulator
MAEVEPPEGLSARKLVLETGKFNVLTAYSGEEAVRTFRRFPTVDALILHTSLRDLQCEDVIRRIREIKQDTRIIVLTPSVTSHCKGADHHVSSHEPVELLALLRSIFGDPRAEAA